MEINELWKIFTFFFSSSTFGGERFEPVTFWSKLHAQLPLSTLTIHCSLQYCSHQFFSPRKSTIIAQYKFSLKKSNLRRVKYTTTHCNLYSCVPCFVCIADFSFPHGLYRCKVFDHNQWSSSQELAKATDSAEIFGALSLFLSASFFLGCRVWDFALIIEEDNERYGSLLTPLGRQSLTTPLFLAAAAPDSLSLFLSLNIWHWRLSLTRAVATTPFLAVKEAVLLVVLQERRRFVLPLPPAPPRLPAVPLLVLLALSFSAILLICAVFFLGLILDSRIGVPVVDEPRWKENKGIGFRFVFAFPSRIGLNVNMTTIGMGYLVWLQLDKQIF